MRALQPSSGDRSGERRVPSISARAREGRCLQWRSRKSPRARRGKPSEVRILPADGASLGSKPCGTLLGARQICGARAALSAPRCSALATAPGTLPAAQDSGAPVPQPLVEDVAERASALPAPRARDSSGASRHLPKAPTRLAVSECGQLQRTRLRRQRLSIQRYDQELWIAVSGEASV